MRKVHLIEIRENRGSALLQKSIAVVIFVGGVQVQKVAKLGNGLGRIMSEEMRSQVRNSPEFEPHQESDNQVRQS